MVCVQELPMWLVLSGKLELHLLPLTDTAQLLLHSLMLSF